METLTTKQQASDILAGIRNGTHEDRKRAFVVLYQQHAGPLQAYLLRLVGCRHKAEDLTQETFLNALKKIDQFTQNSSIKTWLYTIATNLHIDQRRREATIMKHKTEVEAFVISRSTTDVQPKRKAELNSALQDLQQALDNLPDELRAAVVLVRLEGLKYLDAAEVLGISLNALRMRVHRGHLELVRALRGN